ncbi:MAG: mannonate dehydratase [Nitrososphaeria archaeon]
MYISVTLRRVGSRELLLLKKLGVKYVDLSLNILPHCQKDLQFLVQKFNLKKEREKISRAVNMLKSYNISVNSFNVPPIRDALFDKPNGEEQVDICCRFIKFLGEYNIPIANLGLSVRGFGPADVPGRFAMKHEKGYWMGAFSLKLMREELEKMNLNTSWTHHFRERLSFEELFSNCVKVLDEIVPVAEEANVKLAWHPDDPPVEHEKLLPGFTTMEKISSLLDKVNSPNFGLTFCVGTRYESGEDIYKQIEYFGKKGKIFHVHFRNVKGNLLKNEGYEEVALDDGDMNMRHILKALEKAEYNGTLNPDHVPIYTNKKEIISHGTAWALDDPKALQGFIYTIGYIKGLLA